MDFEGSFYPIARSPFVFPFGFLVEATSIVGSNGMASPNGSARIRSLPEGSVESNRWGVAQRVFVGACTGF